MSDERPTPQVEDIEGTRRVLADWLSRTTTGGAPAEVSHLRIPDATGMSNVTLLFDLSWQENGSVRHIPCVGRLQPEIAKPVFPEYDLAMQYQVMETLGQHTPVKTPPLLGLEMDTSVLGTPFYIMQRIPGRVPGDMPPYTMGGWMMDDIGPAERKTLWESGIRALAEIHRQDYRKLGFTFLERPELGDTPLAQQLSYWEHYLEWGLDGTPCPDLSNALAWLRQHQPSNEPTGLCWGDARAGNMIFSDDGQVNAVLDWEMVTLGNPLQDLVWWNYLDRFFSEGLNCPRLEGVPSSAESLALWEAETGLSGANYHYYEVFAGVRYALILSRIMAATGQADQVADHFGIALLRTIMNEH